MNAATRLQIAQDLLNTAGTPAACYCCDGAARYAQANQIPICDTCSAHYGIPTFDWTLPRSSAPVADLPPEPTTPLSPVSPRDDLFEYTTIPWATIP